MNEDLRSAVEEAIFARTGEPARLSDVSPVAGGCIHASRRLRLEDGRVFFCKVAAAAEPADMLEREFEGLTALRRATSLRTVEPVLWGEVEGTGQPFLVTEFVSVGRPGPNFFARFGRGLAELHRSQTKSRFGWEHDNYIGRTPQPNTWSSDWCAFWGRNRLGFQLDLALQNGYAENELQGPGRDLLSQLEERIGGVDEPPCLLHGDLWSGNFLVDTEGQAVLIDPAVYYGQREADLAMCLLFGGFSPAFYDAYGETWPLARGAERRIEVYQLYHLLNHLNLFGRAYWRGCVELLGRVLG